MSKQYQPQTPFNVPFKILCSTMNKVNGMNKLIYNEDSRVYFCSAKAWVGSSVIINDIAAEEDTLTIDSYYISSLKKNDRIRLLDDDSIWELKIAPENINRRNQFMRFKVVRVYG